ncbi:RNA-directed DNA polymerase, eukaryota, reverse transcriptase zinc-binding domain protein, partial [Tanacetum coccineum]
MRTKRSQKIPQNLEDYVHSINTGKSKNKKNSSMNSVNSVKIVNSNKHDNKEKGECNSVLDDGFVRDLNGDHFPPINEVDKVRKEMNDGNVECLDECIVAENVCENSGSNHKADENIVEIDEGSASKSSEKRMNADNGDEAKSGVLQSMDSLLAVTWYHIRRMWNKFGLRDVIAENSVFYFKFQDEEGIKEVINNGPWMVNNKPLVVQKWSIDMCLDKAEPKKIPVWVKLRNVPMEAWSVKGISALASSVGKPIIMDEITTKMCMTGVGRVGFARVLVEIDAEKGIKDRIEIIYKSKNVAEGTKKIVEVDYSWIPCVCSHCKVFGHTDSCCNKKRKVVNEENSVRNNGNEFKVMHNRKVRRDGFNMNKGNNVQSGYNDRMRFERRNIRGNNKWQYNNRFEYRQRKEDKEKGIDENANEQVSKEDRQEKEMEKDKENEVSNKEGSTSQGSRNENGVLGTNRFTLLDSLVDEEELSPNIEQRKIVDEFLSKGNKNNKEEILGWNENMKRYYRDKKELFDAVQEYEQNKDILDENYVDKNDVLRNEVEGSVKVRKIIERFGSKNREERNLRLVWKTDRVKVIKRNERYVVYASNSGIERRSLWRDLEIQKIITNGTPWVIIGDFNVTLNATEYSNGSANPSSEMSQFQDCVNCIEVDDLHSEGFYYTWTKSLRNPSCKTLKKLDRIMVNEAFIDKFQHAHGIFLPYMISDHSPIIGKIPNGVQKRKGSFRFSNFITDKKEFLPIVRSVWNKEIAGYNMYKVVHKLKMLKKKLKQLSWRNRNVFEKAESLRNEVKEIQKEIDLHPHDESIKEKSCQILEKYQEAIQDEYSLLCQKAKVEWLKKGDRNTTYFYKTLKERAHKGRIMSIRNEDGIRFENENVAVQIVRHFEEFLGKNRPVQSLNGMNAMFLNKLNNDEALKMIRQVSDAKIKNAMFDIEDSKALGPDGYTPRFYKSAWCIIGKDVCNAVREFFIS